VLSEFKPLHPITKFPAGNLKSMLVPIGEGRAAV
jgi:hypothetical protein